jgi:hypothetical protein
VVKPARANGSITRNIAEMRHMVTEELPTNSAAMRVNSRGVAAVLAVVAAPVVQVGLVELGARVAQEVLAP